MFKSWKKKEAFLSAWHPLQEQELTAGGMWHWLSKIPDW